MASLPPLVTARELLAQVADSLKLKPEDGRLERPGDCEFMSLLAEATNPYPLHLVNGGNHLEWVRKYAFYYSMGLGKKTAFVCLESRPLSSILSLISLASGIPKTDLHSLQVCRSHFEALNRALEQVWVTNPRFCEPRSLDMNGLIRLIRNLKKHAGVETVIIDALHQVRFDGDTPATRAEQRLISSVLRSTAHVGKLRIVAGFCDPAIRVPQHSRRHRVPLRVRRR